MRLDALESSHPISILVNHPDEIGELFNDISYKKGLSEFFKGSLTHEFILTICKYVTDRSRNYSYVGQFYRWPVLQGWTHLLLENTVINKKKHIITNDLFFNFEFLSSQYGNAVQDDLWNAFDNQAKIDQIFLPTKVKTIMDTWTAKMG